MSLALLAVHLVCGNAYANVTVSEVDISALALLGLQEDLANLHESGFYVFEGVDGGLLWVGGQSWHLSNDALLPWTMDFPKALGSHEVFSMGDGRILGGTSGNHLRYILDPQSNVFKDFQAAQGVYWTDYLEGADIVFARRERSGPLLQLDGNTFVPSQIPEHGQTREGEFLPWYSSALGGYFTAWAADLWFFRPGDEHWQEIEEVVVGDIPPSRAPTWGFFCTGIRGLHQSRRITSSRNF